LLRAIIDYNAPPSNPSLIRLDRSKQMTAYILLVYLLNPGTATVYVGYSNGYENLPIIPGSPAAVPGGRPKALKKTNRDGEKPVRQRARERKSFPLSGSALKY
jgi:hypothetical protein